MSVGIVKIRIRTNQVIILLLALLGGQGIQAQSCMCTACPVRTIDLTPGTIPIEVSGITNDDLSHPDQGVCAVRMQFVHGDIGDMTIDLTSPAGQTIQLVGPFTLCGFTNGNTWDVTFIPCADAPAPDPGMPGVWNNCPFENTFNIEYTGTYHPASGCLEDFDTGPVNGTWSLDFLDNLVGSFGDIQGFEIIFCDPDGVECETPICDNISTMLPDDFTLCAGDQTIIVEGNDPDEFTHEWSTEDGVILDGANTETILIEGPGTYTVIIEGPDAESGLLCSDTGSVVVLESSFPIPELEFDDPYEIDCNNASLVITPNVIVSSGDDSYVWDTDDGNIVGSTTGSSVEVDAAGTYTVVIENPEECGNSYEFEVVENFEEPEFTIIDPVDLTCLFPQSSINIGNVEEGATFLWEGPGIGPDTETDMNQVTDQAGVYSVTVTGTNGCTSEQSVSISIDTMHPTIEIMQDAPLTCLDLEVELFVESDMALTEFIWGGPGVGTAQRFNESILTSTPGLYTVNVTAGINGCMSSATYFLEDETEPPELTSYTDTIRCDRREITLDVNAMGPELQYRWAGPAIDNTNENDSTPVVDQGGLYEVFVSINGNCEVPGFVFVFLDTMPPDVTIIGDEFECGDSTVILQALLNEDGLELEWSGPGITEENMNDEVIETEVPGFYQVTISEDNGCVDIYDLDIPASADIPMIFVNDDTISCNDPTVTLVASSNVEVDFSWTGPGIDDSNRNLPNPSVAIAGTYRITVTDSVDCSNTSIVRVAADTISPVIDVSDTLISCVAPRITLNGEVDQADSIFWAGPGIDVLNQNDLDPTVDLPGTYLLFAFNDNGCSSAEALRVTVDDDLPALVLSADTLTCSNTDIDVISQTDAQVSYNWEGPDSFRDSTAEVNVDQPGSYTLTITTVQGCVVSETLEVIQDIIPPDLETMLDTISCDSQIASLIASSDAAVSYLWDGPGITVDIENEINPRVTEVGLYDLIVTAANGCTTRTSIDIYGDTARTAITLDADTLTCFAPVLAIDNDAIGRSYQWDGPGIDGSNINEQSPDISQAGNYELVLTADNGCQSRATINVPIDTVSPTLDLQVDTLTCALTEVTLELSTDAQVIAWTGPSITPENQNQSRPQISQAGLYGVLVTGQNGCQSEQLYEVQIDTLAPSVSLLSDFLTITCQNPDVTLDAGGSSGQGALEYLWERLQGPLSDELPDTSVVIIDRPGTYVVNIRDEDNGCVNQMSLEIDQDADFPEISIVPYDVITCDVERIVLDGTGSEVGDQVRYFWSGPDINGEIENISVEIGQAGRYTLLVSNEENGCAKDTTITVLDDLIEPRAEASVSDIITCLAPSVNLILGDSDQGAGYDISWSGPGINEENNTSLEPQIATPGLHTLTIRNQANGCISISTVLVEEVDNQPQAVDLIATDPDCDVGNNGSIVINGIVGGVEPYDIYLDGELGRLSLSNIVAGDYQVLVIDANGCEFEDTISLLYFEPLTLDLGEDQEIQLGEEVNVSAEINKDQSVLSEISWSGQETPCENCLDFDIRPFISGIYRLSIRDEFGCTAEDEIYIQVAQGNTLYLPNVFSPNGDETNDRFVPQWSEKVVRLDELSIYDRWGNMVYQEMGATSQESQQGWDGNFKGRPAQSAVYHCRVVYTLVNGLQIWKSADLTLIR